MKKQQTDQSLYSEELDQLDFDQNEQEIRELFERENLPTASELEKYDQLMPNGAERLFNLIEDRYQLKSTIITSQFPVSKWHDYLGEPTIADAILDRVSENARRIELEGESMRKKGIDLS